MIGTTKWIVPIMGFRESAREATGIEAVWKSLRGLLSAGAFMVTPYEWNENLGGLADFIQRNSSCGQGEAMVIAYSWGCGVGFLNFATEAKAVGLPIRYAVLCDPVYRSRILPTWLPFNPLSISPVLRPQIRVPASVERVEWVRQRRGIPAGHDLRAEDPDRTKIGIGRYVKCNHTQIDDSPEFISLANYWARCFLFDLDGDTQGGPDVVGSLDPETKLERIQPHAVDLGMGGCFV